MALGRSVCPAILEAVDHDLENTVFSFIPNTAEVAFYGMLKELDDQLDKVKERRILALGANPSAEKIRSILALRPRLEKVAIKDAKLRTFITADDARDDLVAHVYDITCLLYTSDAADERSSVDLGGRRIIKKKK